MSDTGGVTGDRLRSFIERIERLEAERAEIAAQIKEVKAQAKADGFEIKIINQILKERRQTPEERAEFLALCELYRASLGMLGGTPLGDAARKRFEPDDDEPETPREPGRNPPTPDRRTDGRQASDGNDTPPSAGGPPKPPKSEITANDLDTARQKGRQDSTNGARIIDNPYTANDPRRAAWDEGWCAQSGSDGMEIPEAWRRQKAKKPDLAPVDPTSWPPKPMPRTPDQPDGSGAEAG